MEGWEKQERGQTQAAARRTEERLSTKLCAGGIRALLSLAGDVSSQVVNLLDRHLLREWLKIFGLLLLATLGLLLVQAAYGDLSELLDHQAKLVDVLMYFAVKLPGYLALVLPIALLLSALYTLGQMHRNGEINAQRAAGLGLVRITRAFWVVGALLCGLMWWLNASVVPWSVEETRAIRQNLLYRHEQAHKGEGAAVGVRADVAFDNQRGRRMWFFNQFSLFTKRGTGAMVVQLDARGREVVRLLAREARPDPAGGWVFRDGREILMDPETRDIIGTRGFAEKREPRFNEDPALMASFDMPPADLSFHELERLIDYHKGEGSPKAAAYAVRYDSLLADSVVPLIVILLAVPFAATGVRVNPAVGASKAIGFFLFYYALTQAGYALGAHEVVPPLWAALAPNVAMLAVGGVLFARAR